MSKLSLLIGLTNFLQYDENNIQMKEDFNKFLNIKNQNITLGSNLNTYISEKSFYPKFIADIFEAMVGAINHY